MLPIRWMAPETIQYTCRKFSSASDVWAYGITLWEIYTTGQRPYHNLTNQEVLIKVPGDKLKLTPPENCPLVISNLMTDCWHFEPENRIDFEQIVQILTKNDKTVSNPGYELLYETPIQMPQRDTPEGYIEVILK